MTSYRFRKNCFKQVIAYFSIICLFFCLIKPSSIFADCVYVENDCLDRRTQIAYSLAGLTFIGLGIAAVCLASTTHKNHCSGSSSSSCYSSYWSDYCYSSYYPSCYSSSYSSSSSCHSSKYSARSLKSINEPCLSIHTKSQLLLGSFNFASHLSTLGQGSLTAFIQLPDGNIQHLGRITFSENTGSSLSYGPFDQLGRYTFGVSLDEGTEIYQQADIGCIDIHIDDTSIQRYDLILSPHVLTQAESILYSYDHLNP